MNWQPIETMPITEFDNGDEGPDCLVWVVNGRRDGTGCAAFGRKFEKSGNVRASGFSGNWDITHWCLVEPPK